MGFMISYTKNTLQKIEELFEEIGYVVRYEKGNFQSGYCLVETRKIAVINKFFEAEGRINSLMEILHNLEVEVEGLTEKSLKIYKEIKKKG